MEVKQIPRKTIYCFTFYFLAVLGLSGQSLHTSTGSQTEINKQIALEFYQDLWFTNNTDQYHKYVALEYVVHDTGDRKGIIEPAVEQKNIADFFWKHGSWRSKIDYQVAEGDLVATRWTADYHPHTLFGKIMLGEGKIPIINVFRIKDGKIVEIWNHRHDIDTGQTFPFVLKGFLLGLLLALIPLFIALRLKRKLKRLQAGLEVQAEST